MINWNYNETDYTSSGGNLLRIGNHLVRITNATQTYAKNGTEGLEISLEVYGHSHKLRYYIWFNYDSPGYTNMKLGEFFDSFGISENERNSCEGWVGKAGVVNVCHREYKGRMIAKVEFCIRKEFQRNLPDWQNSAPDFQNTAPTVLNSPPVYQPPVSPCPPSNFSATPVSTYPQPQTQPMPFNGFTF